MVMRSGKKVLLSVMFLGLLSHARADREVITLDCNGVLHGGKDTPLEMSMGMNFLKPMLDHLASKLKERLKCQCPSATATAIDDEFLRKYVPGYALMNFLDSSIWTPDGRKPDITSECDTKADLLYMDELFSYIDIDLPNTCTYDKYKNEGCMIKLKHKQGQPALDIMIGIKQCTSSIFPFVTFVLGGNVADTTMMPCGTSQPCGADMECLDASKDYPLGINVLGLEDGAVAKPPSELNEQFHDAMREAGFNDDSTKECQPFEEIYKDFRQFAARYFPGKNVNGDKTFEFCFPKINANDDFGTFADSMYGCSWTEVPLGETGQGHTLRKGEDVDIESYWKISCTGFVDDWDGKLSNGEHIFAPNRLDGTYFGGNLAFQGANKNAQVVRAMGMLCDMTMYGSLGDGMSGAARLTGMRGIFDFATAEIMKMQKCRATSKKIQFAVEQCMEYFGLWSPKIWLEAGTVFPPQVYKLAELGMMTVREKLDMSSWFGDKLVTVSSCTAKDYLTSACRLKYTGANSLLNLDENGMNLFMGMRQCPAPAAGMPARDEMGLSFQGALPMVLSPLVPCSADSDCTSGSICSDALSDPLATIGWDVMDDLIGESATCSSTDEKNHMMAAVVSYFTKKDQPPDSFKFCVPKVDADGVEDRIDGLQSRRNGQLTLTHLAADQSDLMFGVIPAKAKEEPVTTTPVVFEVKLELEMNMDLATFESKKEGIAESFAELLNVVKSDVSVSARAKEASSRRLLQNGIIVDVTVRTSSTDQAAAVASAATGLTPAAVNSKLQAKNVCSDSCFTGLRVTSCTGCTTTTTPVLGTASRARRAPWAALCALMAAVPAALAARVR